LDQTGVGEAPYEEIRKFAPTIKGITLTISVRQDILGNPRLTMEKEGHHHPQRTEKASHTVNLNNDANQLSKETSGSRTAGNP
jgi:hypothetical protein